MISWITSRSPYVSQLSRELMPAEDPMSNRSITRKTELMLPNKETVDNDFGEVELITQQLEPRLAQKQALEALGKTLEEQYDKAMIVMATGLGKTYLAAFFGKRYRRILFVAHREEILQQPNIASKWLCLNGIRGG